MRNKKLSDVKGMSHNLHFLRFVAATIVIMSHSFALSTGNFENEWFQVISKGQITGGAFAVGVFFLFSGFLIERSLRKNPTCKEFVLGRCVRIFPVLVVVTLLCIFVLGPVVTENTLKEYFEQPETYRYFLNAIFILQHNLPGVFKNNIYAPTINGALWTLPVEFLCYIICLLADKLRVLTVKRAWMTIPVVIVGSSLCYYLSVNYVGEILLTVLFPVLCFYVGAIYCVYSAYITLDIRIFWLMLVGTLGLGILGILKVGIVCCFTSCLIYIAFGAKDRCPRIWKLGNLSYAMYLCAFPIQQLIIHYFGGRMSPYLNILISIPIIIILAYCLYHLVEEKFAVLWKRRTK